MRYLVRTSLLACALLWASASLAQDGGTPGAGGKTEATWWGHAAFIIRTPGGAILAIDPWLKNPLAPKDRPFPESVDAILLTHGHSDHVGNAVELQARGGALVIGSFELVSQLGIPEDKARGMNPGGTLKVKDATIRVVPAVHSSSLSTDPKKPSYAGAPVGYVIEIEKGPTLYHAGDTDAFGDMALVAQRYKPTVGMLPIGGHFTMDPEGAAAAAKLLKLKTVVPMHFGTYPILSGTPEQLRTALTRGRTPAKVLEPKVGQPVSF